MKYAVEDEEQRSTRRGLGRSGRDTRDERQDTEITLGTRSLLGIFFGLILVCGVFFGLGYSVGRVSKGPATPAADAASLTQSGGSPAKPSPQQDATLPAADAVSASGSAPDTTTPTTGSAAGTVPAPAATGAAVPPATSAAAPTPSPVSFPASTAGGPAAATPSTTAAVQQAAATVPAKGTLMVQVAAVSVPQDAQILAAALRRHGFSPVVRHEPGDQLLHIQLGPFATRSEAAAMRGQLLADGYNAVIR